MPTYVQIASYTVGVGGQTIIDFNSIPNTYTDLLFKWSAKSTTTDADAEMYVQMNTDSGSNYAMRQIWAAQQSGGAYFSNNSGTTATYIRIIGGANATNNTTDLFGVGELNIGRYTSTSLWKAVLTRATNTRTQTTLVNASYGVGSWKNSSVAMNNLRITPGAGSFVQNSTFYLYGISNAA